MCAGCAKAFIVWSKQHVYGIFAFNSFLNQPGFKQTYADACVYTRSDGFVIIAHNVDDVLLSKNLDNEFAEFEISYGGIKVTFWEWPLSVTDKNTLDWSTKIFRGYFVAFGDEGRQFCLYPFEYWQRCF